MVNRRRYIRINTVLPVAFYLVDEFAQRITPYLQGFTNNIGRGGICLVVNDLWWGFADRLRVETRVGLQIELPFRKEPIFFWGRIVWKERKKLADFIQYRLGIEFDYKKFDYKKEVNFIFNYAIIKKIIPYLLGVLIILMSIYTFQLWLNNQSLKRRSQTIYKER